MKNDSQFFLLAALALILFLGLQPDSTLAQGTAFTYQGQLQNNGSSANGSYNLTFSLFNNSVGGTAVAGPVNTNNIIVSNGLFTVALDFGSGVWNGATNWLQIGVETNGVSSFTTLSPRQRIAPVPYAIAAAELSGGFTVQNNNTNGAPNLIGGSRVNYVSPGVIGATISGGGATNYFGASYSNSVTANFGTVGGGYDNTASYFSTIAGGSDNTANAGAAVVGGGYENHANGNESAILGGGLNSASADYSTVGGGYENLTVGTGAFIGGGGYDGTTAVGNYAAGNASVIGGGVGNVTEGPGTTVGGGETNYVGDLGSTVSGGLNNTVVGNFSMVGGGENNYNIGYAAVIAGGQSNTNLGVWSVVGGGNENGAYDQFATVAGGGLNVASGLGATISGGEQNIATNVLATVSGGDANTANGQYATVGGGNANSASGSYATVPGGVGNVANGAYSFAAGDGAVAQYQGDFVWADSTAGPYYATAANQFAVRASGGILFAGDLQLSGGAAYHNLSLSGGNSSGYLYGSYPRWGDGIHLGYNYYADAIGGSHIINAGGGTSRISVGYNSIIFATGDVGVQPTYQNVVIGGTTTTVNGTFNNNSDRNAKQDFAPVSASQILDKVTQLPVSEWSYKADSATRHIGPMAQDFYSSFNVGTDEKHIAPIDEGGVALAAIQGLNQKLDDKNTEIQELKQQNEVLEKRLDNLEQVVKFLGYKN